MTRWSAAACAASGLVLMHCLLLAWSGYCNSPAIDEIGHLPSGISHWTFGRFDAYRVNPPLVRSMAALPVLLCAPEMDWRDLALGGRPEWNLGYRMIEINGPDSFWYFTIARWACIPFSIIGAWACYRWAADLFGAAAGLISASLWCLSPNVLANAALITPDTGAASLGVASHYLFWRWLRNPGWWSASAAGVALGLTQLTKGTWVVLFLLWPALWLIWLLSERHLLSLVDWVRRTVQLVCVLFLATYIINSAYGFSGSFTPLGEYPFQSRALTCTAADGIGVRNRFAGTLFHRVPVPLPGDFVMGVDVQKMDFDRKKWSYLRGEHRLGGWWYYYWYCALVKVPLGIWVLGCLCLVLRPMSEPRPLSWRSGAVLIAPAVVVLILVSSHTGFSKHFRYALPALPFVYVWIGSIGRGLAQRRPGVRLAVVFSWCWFAASSLWAFPHSMSYFNELAGGPSEGHFHLGSSNVDWGQDVFYLKAWSSSRPQARPLFTDLVGGLEPEFFDIDATDVEAISSPGWYAISVDRLISTARRYSNLLKHFRPVATAGYSIHIYHLSPEDVRRHFSAGQGRSQREAQRRSRTQGSGYEADRSDSLP